MSALSTAAMREQYAALSRTSGAVAHKEGENPAQVMAKAAKQLSAEYEVPYLAHACMEPLNCVVDLRSDQCQIWTGTQFQTVDRNSAAKAAGLGLSRSRFIPLSWEEDLAGVPIHSPISLSRQYRWQRRWETG